MGGGPAIDTGGGGVEDVPQQVLLDTQLGEEVEGTGAAVAGNGFRV